jgi:hypothetical protein
MYPSNIDSQDVVSLHPFGGAGNDIASFIAAGCLGTLANDVLLKMKVQTSILI